MQSSFYAVAKYDYDEMANAFEYFKRQYPKDEIRAALWNVTEAIRKPFLEMTREEFQRMADSDIVAAYGFSQAALRAFLELQYVLASI